jgi:hypothetical protein
VWGFSKIKKSCRLPVACCRCRTESFCGDIRLQVSRGCQVAGWPDSRIELIGPSPDQEDSEIILKDPGLK